VLKTKKIVGKTNFISRVIGRKVGVQASPRPERRTAANKLASISRAFNYLLVTCLESIILARNTT
jgi:hypothetical protein